MTPDAIVIGGGIVGSSSALRLRQAGLQVLLIDPDGRPRPASYGNAGHIATEQVRPITHPGFLRSAPRRLFVVGGALDIGWGRPGLWLPWMLRAVAACFRAGPGEIALTALLADALPAWERLAADLARPDLLVANGHLLLWHDPGTGRRAAAGRAAQSAGSARMIPMRDAELDRVATVLSQRPEVGLRFEQTGQLGDVGGTMQCLADAFEDAGGQRVRGQVAGLVADGRGFAVTLQDGGTIRCGRVLVAAGVGSRRLLRPLGLRLPLIAERGYHVEWQHGAEYDLPPLVFEDRSLIVTRFGDRLRASSFVEFTSEDAPPDPRKWRRLEAHVAALGLPRASGFVRWFGARPTLPDYLPALGSVASVPGLFVACGHQHLGVTLAPRTAEIVTALMTGQPPPLPLDPFRPDRFDRRRGGGSHRASARTRTS